MLSRLIVTSAPLPGIVGGDEKNDEFYAVLRLQSPQIPDMIIVKTYGPETAQDLDMALIYPHTVRHIDPVLRGIGTAPCQILVVLDGICMQFSLFITEQVFDFVK